jgi:hypothetical protein
MIMSTELNIFEHASRIKLRFGSAQGLLTTEQLWELSLEQLNTMAKAVNKELKAEAEEDFVKAKPAGVNQNEVRLALLKHVIQIKLDALEERRTKAENKQRRDTLLAALSRKEDEQLQNMSADDIRKELEKLS